MKRMTPSWTLCVHGVRFMLALTALTLSACYESETITCSSGLVCPSRMTCSADGRSCLSDSCGDSVRQAGEACDDGNKINGDGCSSDCRSDETCGNGIVDEIKDEVCDFGDAEPGGGCSADCKSDEECGNGIIDRDRGEVCDDRNTVSGDGCNADCKSDESCGNGVRDLVKDEVCDDGNNLNGDQCSADCLSVETCGNGVRDEGEECDDGPSNNEDHCLSSCKLARCGDGVVNRAPDSTEQCDPGVDPSACNYNCTVSQCGDGVVNAADGEQCDLGGGENSSCTRHCKVSYCGDGYTNPAHEDCDIADPMNRDGCLPNCKRDLCGNGVLDPGEVCDDGNRDACGTCNATCTKAQPIREAQGSITVMAEEPDGEKVGKLIDDGWKFTISDGTNLPRGFEFDKPGTGRVTEGYKAIQINNNMTSFDVANEIYLAIRWADSLRVGASYDGAHTISLVHDDEGMRGNQIIVGVPQNQIYDILKISGLSGGVARDCSEGISCKSTDDCAPGLTCRGSPRTCRP